MKAFYAHSTDRADRSDWQTLPDHVYTVAKLASKRATHFGGQSMAEAMGLLHDLGKYSTAFQARLEGDKRRVDHATAGAIEAAKRYGPVLGTIMAYPIAGHHAGLANGRVPGSRRALTQRLESEIEPLDPVWRHEIKLPDITLPWIRSKPKRKSFQFAFVCRMLFSCLVDADYIETENFYARTENRSIARGNRPTLGALQQQLNKHLNSQKGNGPLNVSRRDILNKVRERASETPGHFSLTVPTGGGKTLTSLAFALDHALAHGQDRVIYVIPFTSIVEQNAAVFREALGPYGNEAVLEHHGNFDATNHAKEQGAPPKTADKLKRDSENWNAPIIVTTAVQFFESLFAARPSRCRKLHNIANSVVILDEAQTLPLGLLRPSVAALDELTLNYAASVVYCTATQPALHDTHDGVLPEAVTNVRELAPDPANLFDTFKRVRVAHIGMQSDDALVERLLASDQVLCIVNNRRHARYLFERIADAPGSRHLTTAMYAYHRREVLADVRQRLKNRLPCRLVSTSLIEAGVDVDFPQVLRAEAGLDSIAQAAGRCNREGHRAIDESEVAVFATASEEWVPPPELKRFAQVMGEIMRNNLEADPLSPAMMQRYFEMLYTREGIDGLDEKHIMKALTTADIAGLPFEKIEEEYRLIENTQRTIIIPHGGAKTALSELEYTDHVGNIARRLQRYSVQVPQRSFDALLRVGAITYVKPEVFGEEFAVLVNDDLYYPKSGLNWSDPTFIRAESLLW